MNATCANERVKLQTCEETKSAKIRGVKRHRQDEQLYFGEVPIVQMKKKLFA